MSIELIIIFALLLFVIIAFLPYILVFVVELGTRITETIVDGWSTLIEYIKDRRAEE